MKELDVVQIENYFKKYEENLKPEDRYASFDYCYNYFQSFRHDDRITEIASKENLETSVLQLGFYLASWGMFRASTGLFKHSSTVLKPVIKAIAETDQKFWNIDVDNYTEDNLSDLFSLYKSIKESIKFTNTKDNTTAQEPTLTLVTKIMLGVFGNTPAFDSMFLKGIERTNYPGLSKEKSIKKLWIDIHNFYSRNQAVIDSKVLRTHSFNDGGITNKYPKAKLIDMIFFEHGMKVGKTNGNEQHEQ